MYTRMKHKTINIKFLYRYLKMHRCKVLVLFPLSLLYKRNGDSFRVPVRELTTQEWPHENSASNKVGVWVPLSLAITWLLPIMEKIFAQTNKYASHPLDKIGWVYSHTGHVGEDGISALLLRQTPGDLAVLFITPTFHKNPPYSLSF